MYNSGDAAEQVVRMSLEGAEFALKITGSAAKNLAAALYTVLKDQKKTKGKARIEAMLREKRPLKVYTIKKEDCPEFAKQAKGYGILYAPIPVKKGDDTIDILVFEDDAARARISFSPLIPACACRSRRSIWSMGRRASMCSRARAPAGSRWRSFMRTETATLSSWISPARETSGRATILS